MGFWLQKMQKHIPYFLIKHPAPPPPLHTNSSRPWDPKNNWSLRGSIRGNTLFKDTRVFNESLKSHDWFQCNWFSPKFQSWSGKVSSVCSSKILLNFVKGFLWYYDFLTIESNYHFVFLVGPTVYINYCIQVSLTSFIVSEPKAPSPSRYQLKTTLGQQGEFRSESCRSSLCGLLCRYEFCTYRVCGNGNFQTVFWVMVKRHVNENCRPGKDAKN